MDRDITKTTNTLPAGLTTAEAEERAAKGLSNRTDIRTGKSVRKIISSNLFTYFNLIFLYSLYTCILNFIDVHF